MAWLPGRAGVEEQHSADGVLLAEQRGRPLQRFDGTTLAKATRQLDELAATLARGKTRRPRPKVEAEMSVAMRKSPHVAKSKSSLVAS